jgi:hypothetical protein
VIAAYNPLVLSHFSRAPTDGELALLRTLANEARAAAVGGGILIVIARRNVSGGIDPRVRGFFEQMVREHSDHAGASAAVILMQGFGGSLMRSFLTSLLLLGGKRKLLQIFASADAACRWLAPLHGLDAATLIRAYEQATANINR